MYGLGWLHGTIDFRTSSWTAVSNMNRESQPTTPARSSPFMDEGGAMCWDRITYEMMESYWPAVARGDVEAPRAIREWGGQAGRETEAHGFVHANGLPVGQRQPHRRRPGREARG